ncbi:hypothetical protein [Mucilaginibacter ginsenosidivorax]|uniref:Uncharacterized protein n=1 Tax=Mucilaginibacter ginsenosidivorax TaxID=862126 RepID=A0A5B8W3I2_9SPHI|nr:hypothetical protein [Mucilaginibacter ginsenosidivorax]QEC78351.1 hypothetical protein FSB76_21280 [Mucilaginibacter ginsenosidivorax]
MKPITSIILFILTIIVFESCKYRKDYKACDELARTMKDVHFKDLVKDWGEPYQKEYYGQNDEWLCKWSGVGINGTDAVIHFTNIDYGFENSPFTVRATECTPIADVSPIKPLNPSSNVNNKPENNSQPVEVLKTENKVKPDTIVIDKLDDLPNPSEAVKGEKTYRVMNSTEKDIYEWYVEHYKAQLAHMKFYTYLDDADMAAQSHMMTNGNDVMLYFNKVDMSAN